MTRDHIWLKDPQGLICVGEQGSYDITWGGTASDLEEKRKLRLGRARKNILQYILRKIIESIK